MACFLECHGISVSSPKFLAKRLPSHVWAVQQDFPALGKSMYFPSCSCILIKFHHQENRKQHKMVLSGGPLKSELSSIARTALRPEQLCSSVAFLSRRSLQGSSCYEDETTSPSSRRTGGNYFCPMLSSRVISFSCICCLFSK